MNTYIYIYSNITHSYQGHNTMYPPIVNPPVACLAAASGSLRASWTP